MTSARQGSPFGEEGRTALFILTGAAVLSFLIMSGYNIVDYDAAALTWAAQRMLHGAVFGRDILEVNPPLCALIYMPAVIIGDLINLEWGVRIWMLLLVLASISCLWQTADKSLRVPVITVVLLFTTLAFPNYFAEREQIVFLLCAPYVAGFTADRRWAILSGVMAGIGFMMKPYFLIPLALIWVTRRRLGVEERAILVSGIAYALALLVFFRPYMFEMIPAAMATYWAISFPREMLVIHSAFILLLAAPVACIGVRPPQALPYLMATLGFTIAAILQQKGFIYHFIPAYGFLAVYLVVNILANRPVIAAMSAVLLFAEAALIWQVGMNWRTLYEQGGTLRPILQDEIDKSGSFTSLVPETFAAFPAAIHSPSQYVGMAGYPIFIPAVARYATGLAEGDPSTVNELALGQAIKELAKKPHLVITLKDDFVIDGRSFDVLGWLKRDSRFREEWKNYSPYKEIGQLLLFHRK